MRRDEVEAVLAHEVSHVANGDMITLALIQGVVNAFVIALSRVPPLIIGVTPLGRFSGSRLPAGMARLSAPTSALRVGEHTLWRAGDCALWQTPTPLAIFASMRWSVRVAGTRAV
jgi:predicted ABC-type sugar transport system permease subunit